MINQIRARKIAFETGEQNDPEQPKVNLPRQFLTEDIQENSIEAAIARYAKPIVPVDDLPGLPRYVGGSRYLLTATAAMTT